MTWTTDRRTLLATATLGIGALAIPGFAAAAPVLTATGFTHSVASGEPGADTMLFWTRYVPAAGGLARLELQVSETPDFARTVAGGATVTGPWRDFTAKVTVAGLRPATRYFYRFVAPDGGFSPVGRTKTLPADRASQFRAAVFSCSNMSFGWFNAYAHAAARDDIDLAIHLGDYFYEYAPGVYPPARIAVPGRVPLPANETIALADYRLRYASYRADPDLQELHRVVPWIVSADDHESANDSWEGGAQNHQPSEGDWSARNQASRQAWREWMPVSDEPWKAYDIGELGTVFRTDTRQIARSEAPDESEFFRAADPTAALIAFRNGAWQDPAATMMGSAQEVWLDRAIRESVRARRRWQIVGFGTIMGFQKTAPEAASWLKPDADERARGYTQRGIAAAKAGLPNNLDSWGGYPAARARFLTGAMAANAELIVLSGDSHNGWAFDLAQDGRPAGVEFAGQAVTSNGYESALGIDPKVAAAGMVAANPELKWCDLSRRGYMALTLTPDSARNEWVFCDTVRERNPRASVGHTAVVRRGAVRMSA